MQCSQVFQEAFVSPTAVPTFVFYSGCLEIKDAQGTSWRYQGADVAEVTRRLKRIAENDRLDEGVDADAKVEE